MSDDKPTGFECDRTVDTDGVVGARWWNQALIEADKSASRRSLLKVIGIGALTITTCGVVCSDSCESDDDDYDPDLYRFERRRSLELQKLYGWDFGASGEALVFDGAVTTPFDPASIATLEQDLAPTTTWASVHVPTLLQSPNATPSSRPLEETVPFEPLAKKLRPISTAAMDRAYKAGQALAKTLGAQKAPVAVVADLSGAESVALAAGAADVFEPVFLLDNWPHPRGVVPSHLALAAALYYQPLFVKAKAARPPNSQPLFVLDRARLTTYVDSSGKFDNRYVAKMPSLAALQAAPGVQVKWLLYVVGTAVDLPELDDLNEVFGFCQGSGVPVRALSLDMFTPGADGGVFYSGGTGTGTAEEQFIADYPPETGGGVTVDAGGGGGAYAAQRTYHPTYRSNSFLVGSPTDFGTANVALAAGTGAVLGASFDRRGSWNRTGG